MTVQRGSFLIAAVVAVLGLVATARGAIEDLSTELTPLESGAPRGFSGGECCCTTPRDCGNFCCAATDTCNLQAQGCCPSHLPIPCAHTCCAANETCGADGFTCIPNCAPGSITCAPGRCCPGSSTCNPLNQNLCCPSSAPIPCQFVCCPVGGTCSADGTSCGASCGPGNVDCFNGYCCAAGQTCNTLNPSHTLCCPSGSHACLDGCCAGSDSCNTVNTNLCCPVGFPVPCANTCCREGQQCSADGFSCIDFNPCPGPSCTNPCTDPNYPRDCGNGFCCPFYDRCQNILSVPWCCLDIPEHKGCCPPGDLIKNLGGTAIQNTSKGNRGSKCKKSTKVRPFEILQIAAGSKGTPSSFDPANHDYSVGFSIGSGIVLKVPIVQDDSSASSLSVMIPPFMLTQKSHGKADVFLVTDGVQSDECVTKVRISKLAKSISKVPGLVTHSWLRANHAIYTTARPTLGTAAAAPFVNPEILGGVDNTIAQVGSLLPDFEVADGKGPGKGELAKTAKAADILISGILGAAQKVGDSGFAGAAAAWAQALKAARDSNDAALKAAEINYANTLLNVSGASAPSVARFATAAGAVTTAGIGASAASVAGGATPSTAVDAQAAATVIAGATISATSTICGVSSLVAGAASPASGRSAFGKMLLQGTVQHSTSTRINYGGINLGSAKLCGCRQPPVKRIVDTCTGVIVTCDNIRRVGPRFCFPDVPAQPARPTARCGNGIIDAGEDCDIGPQPGDLISRGDVRGEPPGCNVGQSCEVCRCVGTGDVRVTLAWATSDDLDVHVIEPSNEEIYYGHLTSATGGRLDVDSNAACTNPQTNPVENIFWATGTAPFGTYTVLVDYYRHCSSDTEVPFSVNILVDGTQTFFDGVLNTADSCGACTSCGTCSLITTFTR
jgi:hypothetical protein